MVTKKPKWTEILLPGAGKGENSGIGHGRGGKRYEADRCDDKDIIVVPGTTYYGGDIGKAKKKIERAILESPLEVE